MKKTSVYTWIFRGFALIVLMLGSLISCSAQNDGTDNSISLNGTWDIIFDDENEGVKNSWYLDAVFETQQHQKIDVPSCWESFKKNYERRTPFENTISTEFCKIPYI